MKDIKTQIMNNVNESSLFAGTLVSGNKLFIVNDGSTSGGVLVSARDEESAKFIVKRLVESAADARKLNAVKIG